MIHLQIEGLTKSFGDRVLFSDISFGLSEGERVGLIAKNGTGKTTLLNIIAGDESYDAGTITFRNDLRVGYLRQLPFLIPRRRYSRPACRPTAKWHRRCVSMNWLCCTTIRRGSNR